ncbi:peptidoglycan DD-metalloendopeptidase family protein [Jiella marina]|uniref:peptidoglycan DD-metalloendopeptidase family protein n=1 Tax=Jiella sp. LLJ827 TaxID=2917712 RepID=UPI002101235A|nr:M23 family metallopeptidase [Jiella sp. LLJ827]MCQ0990454.1 peptidoglycan DD-metalloendopeptidase family protein [Jiella sp. LLJ827]
MSVRPSEASHGIDPSFRRQRTEIGDRRARRRARRRIVAAVLAGLGLCFLAVSAVWWIDLAEEAIPLDYELTPVAEDAATVAEVETSLAEPGAARPMMLDLPGDPLLVTLGGTGEPGSRLQEVARPDGLEATLPADRLVLLADRMVSASESFMARLPSSQADFAFFQSQRGDALAPGDLAPPVDGFEAGDGLAEVPEAAAEIEDAEAAGWGETIDAGEAALPEFARTRIENTTSRVVMRPEAERFAPFRDVFIRVLAPAALDRLLVEHGFDRDDAETAAVAVERILDVTKLEAGMVVGVRGHRDRRDARPTVAQLSLHRGQSYVGTLARDAGDDFVAGADPFADRDLVGLAAQSGGEGRQYRLLDAVYSTGIRNGVPMAVVGEAIMLLSRGNDLDAIATAKDRLVLIYDAAGEEEPATGRVRYVAIQGRDEPIACFVFGPPAETPNCHDGTSPAAAAQAGSTPRPGPGGMTVPVKGVLTSTFGPRKHPILKTVRIHKGVDWAAPTGTPVLAAFDGTVSYAGDGKGYGNFLKIDHGGGRVTHYAHLSRFAPAARPGRPVRAGEVVGYVGTTGLSTGPHLHFELFVDGKATDPLAEDATRLAGRGPKTAAEAVPSAATGHGAVDQLVGWIIRVESAGNPRAKNSRSSATGLGQFISSTWLRMMRTYRPDLATSLSRAELLDLRYDPTLSREMVRNLAREGEAYLVRRDHKITAGRLYLAHFLGMEGASTVLSADPDRPLVDVVGAGVISANPFLAGKSVRYVVEWAERKMSRSRRATAKRKATQSPAYQPPRPMIRPGPDPAFLAYKKALLALLEERGISPG